jgi:hypothetical protein
MQKAAEGRLWTKYWIPTPRSDAYHNVGEEDGDAAMAGRERSHLHMT